MRKIEEKFDHLGNRVVLGDMVVIAPPNGRGDVYIARVVKLTPKGVTVYVEGSDYPKFRGSRRFNRLDFVRYER